MKMKKILLIIIVGFVITMTGCGYRKAAKIAHANGREYSRKEYRTQIHAHQNGQTDPGAGSTRNKKVVEFGGLVPAH